MRTLFALVLLSGCAGLAPADREIASAPYPARIIDAHAHFEPDVAAPPSDKMTAEYAAAGVVGAVVHAGRRGGPQAVRPDAPVKFAYCAAVVPPRSVAEIERGLKSQQYACLKIYLAYVPRWASDPYYKPFYRLAEKYKVPVVFHTGDPIDKDAPVKYADPLTIDEIAIQHRKVQFVLAHMGNPWIESAAEVVYKNDNVAVDLSALMIGDLSTANPEAVDELVVKPVRWFYLYVENPKKLLFGTDWPLANVKSYIAAITRAIPPKDWDDVFYNNAARIFFSAQKEK